VFSKRTKKSLKTKLDEFNKSGKNKIKLDISMMDTKRKQIIDVLRTAYGIKKYHIKDMFWHRLQDLWNEYIGYGYEHKLIALGSGMSSKDGTEYALCYPADNNTDYAKKSNEPSFMKAVIDMGLLRRLTQTGSNPGVSET
jgi:hypothetical protein